MFYRWFYPETVTVDPLEEERKPLNERLEFQQIRAAAAKMRQTRDLTAMNGLDAPRKRTMILRGRSEDMLLSFGQLIEEIRNNPQFQKVRDRLNYLEQGSTPAVSHWWISSWLWNPLEIRV